MLYRLTDSLRSKLFLVGMERFVIESKTNIIYIGGGLLNDKTLTIDTC